MKYSVEYNGDFSIFDNLPGVTAFIKCEISKLSNERGVFVVDVAPGEEPELDETIIARDSRYETITLED